MRGLKRKPTSEQRANIVNQIGTDRNNEMVFDSTISKNDIVDTVVHIPFPEQRTMQSSGISTVFVKQVVLQDQPNEEMIIFIIQHAIQTPSGDNAQPWKFVWSNNTLVILHSEETGRHTLNRANHASMIALGSVLESIRISSTRFGFKTKVKYLFQHSKALSAWAEVTFSQQRLIPDLMLDMISLRSTDRREFIGGRIDLKLRQQLAVLQQEFTNCKIHIRSKPSKKFMNYFLKAEEYLWKNKNIVKDLCHLLRLTKTEDTNAVDGMSWKNININKFESFAFRLIRRFPVLPRLMWSFGFGFQVKQLAKKSIESSAALICFSIQSVTPEALAELGQAAYRTWLILNSNKFGVQPLSFSSSSIADLVSGALTTNQAEVSFFSNGKNILQKTFSMQANDIPVWMFRTGLSGPLPAEMRTKRKSVANLLVSPDYLKLGPDC